MSCNIQRVDRSLHMCCVSQLLMFVRTLKSTILFVYVSATSIWQQQKTLIYSELPDFPISINFNKSITSPISINNFNGLNNWNN